MKDYPQGEKLKQRFIERMPRAGFEGPVCYYLSLANDTMLKDKQELCEKGPNREDKRKIDVPLLYIGQRGDWVCRTHLMIDAKEQGLVPDLEEKVIQAGHWCL
jgi:soluble epoxide hydrolase / lipid-phosphate phosphatase